MKGVLAAMLIWGGVGPMAIAKPELWGVFHDRRFIEGRVTNAGERNILFVRVEFILLDRNRQAIGAGFAFTDPTAIAPGETATFRAPLKGGVETVQIYRIKYHQ